LESVFGSSIPAPDIIVVVARKESPNEYWLDGSDAPPPHQSSATPPRKDVRAVEREGRFMDLW